MAYGKGSMAVVVAAVLAFAGPARGEELGIEQAVARAIARHPALTAAGHATEGAEARTDQARTGWLPRITLDGSYRYTGPIPELAISTGITPPGATEPVSIRRDMGTEHNASVNLRVAWRAYDFGARDLRTESAEAGVVASKAERDERATEIAYAVRASYLAAQLFGEVEATTLRAMATVEVELAEQRIRREAGVGDDLAVAGVEARLAELEVRATEAARNRDQALAALRIVLAVPDEAPLTLTDDLATLGAVTSPAAAPSDEPHPTVRRLAALREATGRQDEALGRQLWPTLDVFGVLSYQYPKSFFETDEGGPVWTAGVSLTWEVFDGDLRRRQRHELAARSAEVEALSRAAEEDILRKEAEAMARLRAAARAALAAERSVAAAEVYLRAADASSKAGTGTALDVRKAEEAVDRARLAQLQARFDAALARAELAKARGRSI